MLHGDFFYLRLLYLETFRVKELSCLFLMELTLNYYYNSFFGISFYSCTH
jgi:hypothetical protein